MREHLLTVIEYLWSAFGVYWVAAAVRGKSNPGLAPRTGERHLFRAVRLSVLVTTFGLLFWHRLAVGFLGRRFVSDLTVSNYAGSMLTLAGLGIAVWARIHLAQYW